MADKANLLWLDLEMTGLDPVHDRIIEVAIIATDWKFNEIFQYRGIVKLDESFMRQRMDANGEFWNAHPDSRDGLIHQNASGKSVSEIENDILKLVDEQCVTNEPVVLAGNSIHMDRRFIDAEWPHFSSKLYYRMLDVSAWKLVFEHKYKKHFLKPEVHRALDDISGSIDELRYYLGYLDQTKLR